MLDSVPIDRATPFDQEQRYRLIGDLLRAVRGDGPPLFILDVGGRTGVLRKYLAEDDRVILADLEESEERDLVLASGSALPFEDRMFDAVVAADTLEHVPVDAREAFVLEACRVAKGVTVLAGPYYHPRVAEAEQRLAEFVRSRLGKPHRYLEEHLALGLPDRDKVEAWCRDAGAKDVRALGHGNLERWLGLMSLALLLDDEVATRDVAGRFHSFYNLSLLPEDRSGQVYRHLVVAVMGEALPESVEQVFAPRELAEESGEPVLHALDHLSAFDHARDLFEAERDRLEAEIGRRDQDLEGHRVSLVTADEDLAQHKVSLAEAEEQLAQHKEALAEAIQDLKGHAETLTRVRDDLVEHQQALVDAREALASAQQEIEVRGQELEQARAEGRELDRQLAEANATFQDVHGQLQQEIGVRGQELEQARAEGREVDRQLVEANATIQDVHGQLLHLLEETRRYRKVRDFILRRKQEE